MKLFHPGFVIFIRMPFASGIFRSLNRVNFFSPRIDRALPSSCAAALWRII